jgi:predicted ATP-dependent Lon-type protease
MSSSEVVIEEVTKSETVAGVVSTSLELERVVTAAVQAAVEPLQRSINDLTTSVNDLKTSIESLVKYFKKTSSEMISPSKMTQNDYFYDFENVCEDGLSNANNFLLISFYFANTQCIQ